MNSSMSFNKRYVPSGSMNGNSVPAGSGSVSAEVGGVTGLNEANVSDVVSVGADGGVTMTNGTGAVKIVAVSIGEGGGVVGGGGDGVLFPASVLWTHIPFKPWPVSCVGSTL